jgi:nitroreductase
VTALHPLLAARWSPRAFDATHVLTDDDVGALLEAARWAPSASNSQPWRFAVAHRGTPEHAAVVEALVGWNQQWAPAASVLLVAAAVTVTDEGKPLRWAAYDTGQAVAHLSLQAQAMGLVVHQMGGFDTEAVARLLGSDQALVPQTVVAVGRHDPSAALPEKLAAREAAPRERLDTATLLRPITTSA